MDLYEPGKSQPSFDKQYVRDHLLSTAWDKTPPAPALPEEVTSYTTTKYREIYEKLTGQDWSWRAPFGWIETENKLVIEVS